MLDKRTWLRAAECGIPFVRITDGAYSGAFAADGTVLEILGAGTGRLDQTLSLPSEPRRCGEKRKLFLFRLLVLLASLQGFLIILKYVIIRVTEADVRFCRRSLPVKTGSVVGLERHSEGELQ